MQLLMSSSAHDSQGASFKRGFERMTVTVRALTGALLVACAASGHAQNTPAQPAPVQSTPIPVGTAQDAVLRTGTPVSLKLKETLTTKGKQLKVGQRFHLEVAEPVMVNGQVVMPAGTPATGEVTEVRNKGMWGKSGHLTAQLLYAQVNGRQIRLNGTFDDKGVTGTAGVVGAIAFVPVAGFFISGTSAVVPVGTPISGFVGEDVPVMMAATPQAPLMATPPATIPVSAPAPAMATASPAVVTKAK